MSFGIQLISFQDDWLQPFGHSNWNLSEELFSKDALILQHDELGKRTVLISMLVDSPDQRQRNEDHYQKHAKKARGTRGEW